MIETIESNSMIDLTNLSTSEVLKKKINGHSGLANAYSSIIAQLNSRSPAARFASGVE